VRCMIFILNHIPASFPVFNSLTSSFDFQVSSFGSSQIGNREDVHHSYFQKNRSFFLLIH